jgi:hypothetical protein
MLLDEMSLLQFRQNVIRPNIVRPNVVRRTGTVPKKHSNPSTTTPVLEPSMQQSLDRLKGMAPEADS